MNILVVSTDDYLTLRLLKCLAPLKACVHILASGRSPALRSSRHRRHYHAANPATLPDGTEIEGYCCRNRIDVVLPSGMASVLLLSELKEKLESRLPETRFLPMPPVDLLRMLNNKWRFSRFLERHELPFPQSRLLERAGDAPGLDLPFPIIIKPLELDASRGVARCDTPSALQTYLKRRDVALPLLVQEYIPGEDVGLGILAHQGEVLAWTIQKQQPDGSGVEFIEHTGILDVGRQIMSPCQYNGIAHFDLRIDARDGSVNVLECNPRFWASLPFCMIAGVNFADQGMRLAQGRPLPGAAYETLSLTFPGRALRGALSGASGWRLSQPSRRALRVTLADPLPQVYLGAGKIRRRMTSLFSGIGSSAPWDRVWGTR